MRAQLLAALAGTAAAAYIYLSRRRTDLEEADADALAGNADTQEAPAGVSAPCCSPPCSPPPCADSPPAVAHALHPNYDLVVQPGTDAVAIDCEMVQTSSGSELARVCVVAVGSEEVLLDTHVAPAARVKDYLTQYSGVRPKDLEGAPSFAEARALVVALVDGKALVGHGVQGDLRALKLEHPPALLVDTLELEWGSGRRRGLAFLSLELLGQPIQVER